MSAPGDGHDADLDRLRSIAQRLDDLFEMDMLDAPGFIFVGARFAVEGGARGGPWHFSAGGVDAHRQRAFRRCAGEAAETLSQFIRLRADAVETFGEPAGIDAEERALLEALAGPAAMAAGWIGARRLSDGGASRLPAALVFRDAAPGDAVLSTGCAAGRTLEAATLSALFELIERDAVALWWNGGAPATRIREPALDAAITAMRGDVAAPRETWFLDLTTDIGVPVAAALSCGRDGRGVEAGFASRATFAAAARAALRELAQMELGGRLVAIKARHGGREKLAATERRQLERMAALAADHPPLRGREGPRRHARLVGGEGDLVRSIVALLSAKGIGVHLADLTDAGSGLPVVKLVAPLLQSAPVAVATPRLAATRVQNGLDGEFAPLAEIV